MKIKTELTTEPKIGTQRPDMAEIDTALRRKLAALKPGQELKVWPDYGGEKDHSERTQILCAFKGLAGRYLKAQWPELRVRTNVDADYFRIGFAGINKRSKQQ